MTRASNVAGGSGGETTNGITACIVDTNGVPVKGAVVRLRRSDYVTRPPSLGKSSTYGADILTDSLGRFALYDIDMGHYRLEVTAKPGALMIRLTSRILRMRSGYSAKLSLNRGLHGHTKTRSRARSFLSSGKLWDIDLNRASNTMYEGATRHEIMDLDIGAGPYRKSADARDSSAC